MAQPIGIAGFFRPDQQAGGVYSVFQNLLRGFAAQAAEPDARFELNVFHGRNEPTLQAPGLAWRRSPLGRNRFAAESLVGLGPAAAMQGMLYPNYFLPPVCRAGRSVTILHDLQYRTIPEVFSPKKRFWLERCIRHTLNHADRVVTISGAVRDDVLNQFGPRYEDRVTSIWNPVDLARFEAPSDRDFTGGRPYVLGVAIDRPQKNLATLVRAFGRLAERWPDCQLALAGQLRSEGRSGKRDMSSMDNPSTIDLVRELGLEDRVVITGFVSDAELGALYRGASLFVFPSLFEGFGMPPIEAMAMGTPALVTDLPVLREVTLGMAHYLDDPRDPAALAERIEAVLADPAGHSPTPDQQAELKDRFSPATVAGQYLDLLLN